MKTAVAILFDPEKGAWLSFGRPRRIVTARSAEEVLPALAEVEAAAGEGLHAAGFLSYEAGAAFDPACATCPDCDFPLLWFGLFDPPQVVPPPVPVGPRPSLDWRPALGEESFAASVAAIRGRIAAGETYQVNLTFPLTAPAPADPWTFFAHLVQGQGAGQAAFLDTGRFVICSASPELFFRQDGERLRCRPMKGTAPRGLTLAEDRGRQRYLIRSEKDRAENVMILDMVRNDLGRLGPVTVPNLFTVEKYPTVWQLTSEAACTTLASLAEIFGALFPSASITGAPKYRTMAIIRELERRPRRIYTGAVGWVGPGRQASFSVAIRTALIDRQEGSAEYRVGAGITWGSDPSAEYRECLDKARILTVGMEPFELLETLLWTPGEGYHLLQEHLDRLSASARYFDVPCDRRRLRRRLAALAAGFDGDRKVRLLLSPSGEITLEAERIEIAGSSSPLALQLARQPVSPDDPFLYHKTTRRRVYEEARHGRPGAEEVLLWNDRGEVTEACNYNLVVERDGRRVTPPVSSGLLAGTLRARLLARGEIREETVRVEELGKGERLWLINSVRGWREGRLVSKATDRGVRSQDK